MKAENVPAEWVELAAAKAWNAKYTASYSNWDCHGIDESGPTISQRNQLRDQMRAAIAAVAPLIAAAEREECARIATYGCLVPPDGGSPTENEVDMCNSIAAAIRARGNK